MTLENFTTTIVDLDKKRRKYHFIDPVFVDEDNIKVKYMLDIGKLRN